MFFQIQENVSEIALEDVKEDILSLGILSLDELEQCYEQLGFSNYTIAECKNDTHHFHGSLDTYNDYLFGIIVGINAKQIIKIQDRIGIYIKRNLLLIVIIEDQDNSVRHKFLEFIKRLNIINLSMERLISGFLGRLVSEDYETLEQLEARISKHEDLINDGKLEKKFNYRITDIRKKLLVLDNYYQQLIAFGEELEENVIDLFDEENLRYFRMFCDRVARLSDNTRMLQEYCVQVREAYHEQLDFNLNNIMKVFTVVTTIFLPLTLIVGWYGMNFTTMPEITWEYGYLYVIVLSVIVAIICFFFFKKKKFL
jgi:magnesium transporter